MERPIFKPIGTPTEELDTPALVVDLAVLDRNIDRVHSFFRQSDAKVRPHVSSHWCPAIAHKQMAAGGTAGGISVTTVGVAEVFAANGFDDIFVANEVVTPQKIKRLCALARRVTILVAVDNPRNVVDLSEAAQAANVRLKVVVDINTGLDRCGVEPGQPAVDLAQAVSRVANLEFAGLMTYEGSIAAETTDELADASRRAIQPLLDTKEMVENAGILVSLEAYTMRGGKLPRRPPTVAAKDIGPGKVFKSENWEVTSAPAEHVQPWLDSLAYRLDSDEGSVVVTGNTRPCESVAELAQGADTLIYVCVGIQSVIDGGAMAKYMSGTTQAGKLAQEASAKRLILVHNRGIGDHGPMERAIADVAKVYDGEIIMGEEMLEMEL